MSKLKILGVNAGNGTVLFPFKKNLIGNIEPRSIFYTPKDEQWKLNFGDIPFFKINLGLKFNPDIIIGHPNCGASSILSYSRAKKLSNPKKDVSVELFHYSLKEYKPKLFLFENLPKFLDNFTEEEINTYFCGYKLKIIKQSVFRFGNSQKNRKRLVIVGIRNDIEIEPDFFKLPKKSKLNHRVTSELLEGLGDEDINLGHIREDIKDTITLYGGFKSSLLDIQLKWVTELKDKQRWPAIDRKYSRAPGVYKNLPNKYPNTVRKGNREFNPDGLMMSPRERARIQGIPDDFKIMVNLSMKKRSINKGRVTVTKCFPYEISLWFKAKIKKLEIQGKL